MSDIIERLTDLHKQATTERSHYYTATCLLQAIEEIQSLRAQVRLLSGDAAIGRKLRSVVAVAMEEVGGQ